MHTTKQRCLLGIVILLAIIEVIFEFHDFSPGIYLVKPLVIIALIQVWILEKDTPSNFSIKFLLLSGLLFSLVGDVLLMMPDASLFVFGLISFLCTHILYSITFIVITGWGKLDFLFLLPVILVSIVSNSFILPATSSLKIPIIVYGIFLGAMLWRASCILPNANFSLSTRFCLTIGALSFVISDTCLALNKFVSPIPFARVAIMSTYLLAQILISQSILKLSRYDCKTP